MSRYFGIECAASVPVPDSRLIIFGSVVIELPSEPVALGWGAWSPGIGRVRRVYEMPAGWREPSVEAREDATAALRDMRARVTPAEVLAVVIAATGKQIRLENVA